MVVIFLLVVVMPVVGVTIAKITLITFGSGIGMVVNLIVAIVV